MKSLLKMICAFMAAGALMSSIIMTAGCDDTVWNNVNTPSRPLLLLGQVPSKQNYFITTVTTNGTSGIWSGLGINIDGHVFTVSSILPTFILETPSDTISSVTVSQSPDSYSCFVKSFTPDYWFYTLNITVQCNSL